MYTSKQIAGYSLVETLVAIAILLLALVGPMTIASKSIQSAQYSREQTTAIFLAQEGIEAFVQARNDVTIAAFANGTLQTSWNWVTDGTINASCLSAAGCNIDFDNNNPLLGTADCTSPENCRLYFDDSNPNARARYSLISSGTKTPYRRVIHITPIAGGKGIQIDSTIFWDTRLFGTQEQNFTLTSTLFSLYE